MKVEIVHKEQCMYVKIVGDIDHHNAKTIREKIDLEIAEKKPNELVLDFNLVSFMDSSGIGLIMGRYTTISAYGGKIAVINVNSSIYKVMLLSNLSKIAIIKKRGEN